MQEPITKLIDFAVSELLSELLSTTKTSFVKRIRANLLKKELHTWMCQFVNSHDGSILTTDAFAKYLAYHKPLDKIFDAVIGYNPLGTKESLLENIVTNFKQNESSNRTSSHQDEALITDLFDGIYQRIDCFYRTQLSDSEKYLISKLKEQERNIIKVAEKGFEEFSSEIQQIQDLLKENQDLKTEDTRWIYHTVWDLLAGGNANAVNALLPLLRNNASDLAHAIPYLLNLVSNYNIKTKSFAEIQTCIEDDIILSDVIRKTIYYALIYNDLEMLNQVGNRNWTLKRIASNLISFDYSSFYVQKESINNGITTISVEIQNNYPDEKWLVVRICAINMFRKPIRNVANVFLELSGNDLSITDKIIFFERKAIEIHSTNYDDTAVAEKIYSEMMTLREKIGSFSQILQEKYYAALLKTAVLISAEVGENAISYIPQANRNNKSIEMYCMQVSIMSGTADEDRIIQVCVSNDQYWLFNNYLLQFQNDPIRTKSIVEKYKFIIPKDVSIFLIYVQVISITEGKEKGKELFDVYENNFSNCWEYWLGKIEYSTQEEAHGILKYLREKKDLCACSPRTKVAFIQMLYDFELYEDVLQEIAFEGAQSTLVGELLYIKAMALYKTKKEILALDIFRELFSRGQCNSEIIFYVLLLSNRNNREVSDVILSKAEETSHPLVLLQLSHYYELHQNIDLAETTLLRSLFHNEGHQDIVFGNYLRLHTTKNYEGSPALEISGIDSAVFLRSSDGTRRITYCIHKNPVLPDEPYEWEESNHIYKDTAIQLGLYRKKVGDPVKINNNDYVIAEILTLDCFLFRLSMQKIVDAGKAKCIYTPVDDEGQIRLEELKQELLKNLNETDSEPHWLSLYKDMSVIPTTINHLEKYVRLNYLHLTMVLLRDTNIIMRELTVNNLSNIPRFVLSFTTIVALHEIGFNIDSCSYNLSTSASCIKEIDIEAEEIISEYSRDIVATIGVQNGQLYLSESSDDDKHAIMQSAVSIKTFAHKIKSINNGVDLYLCGDPQFDCKEFLGIGDYDNIAIAKDNESVLVTFEAVISGFAGFKGINVKTIGLADFVAFVCDDPNKLLDYVKRMFELRFMLPITQAVLQKTITLYESMSVQEQESFTDRWDQILDIPLQDEKYKSIIAEQARNTYVQMYETVSVSSPIWRVFVRHTLDYLGYKIQLSMTPNGEIDVNLVKADNSQ